VSEVVVAAGSAQPVQGVGGTPGVKPINYTIAELRPDASKAPQFLSKGPLVLEDDGAFAPEMYSKEPLQALETTLNGKPISAEIAALAGDGRKGGSSVLTFLPYAAGPIIGLLAISSKDDKAEELITVVPQQVAAFEKYDRKNPANIVVVPVETMCLSKSLKAVSALSPGLPSTIQPLRDLYRLPSPRSQEAVLSVVICPPLRVPAGIAWEWEGGKPCTYPELEKYVWLVDGERFWRLKGGVLSWSCALLPKFKPCPGYKADDYTKTGSEVFSYVKSRGAPYEKICYRHVTERSWKELWFVKTYWTEIVLQKWEDWEIAVATVDIYSRGGLGWFSGCHTVCVIANETTYSQPTLIAETMTGRIMGKHELDKEQLLEYGKKVVGVLGKE
jgi:hypothetical protein